MDVNTNFSKVLNSFYVYTGDADDKHVQNACRKLGAWDMQLTEWMQKNIKPGWVCLDIGANIFYFTELMSRLSGPSGKVLAFEPIKRLCDMYEISKELNSYDNCSDIEVYPFALSSKEEDLILNIWNENIGGSGIVENHQSGIHDQYGTFYTSEIHAKRLDSVYSGPVDFIKIDVEGHESLVFDGFSDAAKECELIVAELGYGQPEEFLLELDNKYVMEFLNGEIATIDKIKEYQVVNVLLRRK